MIPTRVSALLMTPMLANMEVLSATFEMVPIAVITAFKIKYVISSTIAPTRIERMLISISPVNADLLIFFRNSIIVTTCIGLLLNHSMNTTKYLNSVVIVAIESINTLDDILIHMTKRCEHLISVSQKVVECKGTVENCHKDRLKCLVGQSCFQVRSK